MDSMTHVRHQKQCNLLKPRKDTDGICFDYLSTTVIRITIDRTDQIFCYLLPVFPKIHFLLSRVLKPIFKPRTCQSLESEKDLTALLRITTTC